MTIQHTNIVTEPLVLTGTVRVTLDPSNLDPSANILGLGATVSEALTGVGDAIVDAINLPGTSADIATSFGLGNDGGSVATKPEA